MEDVTPAFRIEINAVGRILSPAFDSSSNIFVPMDSSSYKFFSSQKKKCSSSQMVKLKIIPLRKKNHFDVYSPNISDDIQILYAPVLLDWREYSFPL